MVAELLPNDKTGGAGCGLIANPRLKSSASSMGLLKELYLYKIGMAQN
jgi:hypothetical protein